MTKYIVRCLLLCAATLPSALVDGLRLQRGKGGKRRRHRDVAAKVRTAEVAKAEAAAEIRLTGAATRFSFLHDRFLSGRAATTPTAQQGINPNHNATAPTAQQSALSIEERNKMVREEEQERVNAQIRKQSEEREEQHRVRVQRATEKAEAERAQSKTGCWLWPFKRSTANKKKTTDGTDKGTQGRPRSSSFVARRGITGVKPTTKEKKSCVAGPRSPRTGCPSWRMTVELEDGPNDWSRTRASALSSRRSY